MFYKDPSVKRTGIKMRPNIVDYEENPVFVGCFKDNEINFYPWLLALEDNRSNVEIIPLKYSKHLT